jgi:hypothetical protein
MAILHIREAFNQEAGDSGYSCQKAFLDYVTAPGEAQKQVITFVFVDPDGATETMQTPIHSLDANTLELARDVVRQLKARDLAEGKTWPSTTPVPYEPGSIDAPLAKWEALKNGHVAPPLAPEPPAAPAPKTPPNIPTALPKNPFIEG